MKLIIKLLGIRKDIDIRHVFHGCLTKKLIYNDQLITSIIFVFVQFGFTCTERSCTENVWCRSQ